MMLSLSMVVCNEEASLGAALESVRDFVDEMVVLDTGSTDDTVAVAKSLGARVEHLPWPGDFAPARNFALDLVQGDWVLVIDADEQLCPACIPKLKELISEDDLLLVNLLRFEKGATMAPYSSVSRLFRRHPKIHWSRPYHSMVDDSVSELLKEEPQWRIVDCGVPALEHDGYKPELIQRNQKAERLRIAMESWLVKNPRDPYACAKLGALEIAEGKLQQGLKLLQEGLSHDESKGSNPSERYELLVNLGIALTHTDPDSAVSAYRKALELPLDVRVNLGARLNLAGLLMQCGEFEEAITLTTQATEKVPEVALCWYNLGLMKRQRGDLIGAIDSYQHALELNPSHPETYQNLALARLLLGDVKSARDCFKQAIWLFSSQNRLEEADSLRQKLHGVVKLDDD